MTGALAIRWRSDERGAVASLILAELLVGLVLVVLTVDVARVLTTRATATTAADAAALAAAPLTFAPFGGGSGPVAAAQRLAEVNGARLTACRCARDGSWRPRTVTVVVSIPVRLVLLGPIDVTARAAAEFVPTDLVGTLPGLGRRG